MIGRREFVQGAGAILMSAATGQAKAGEPPSARAQASLPAIPRVAVLGESNPISWMLRPGVVELECRWTEDGSRRIGDLAAELVSLEPGVIVAVGLRPSLAAIAATATTTVIVVAGADVIAGIRKRRANVAGVAVASDTSVASQRLGLLRRTVPALSRIGVLHNPGNAGHGAALSAIHRAAEREGIETCIVNAGGAAELERVLARLEAARVGALIVLPDTLFSIHGARIVERANEMRLPGIYPAMSFTRSGGLMSLQGNHAEVIRQTGGLIQTILMGADPATLPIVRLDRLELSINLVTASALGLDLAPSLLAGADTIIRSAGAVRA